jgi:hypothetical protein
VVTAGDSAGVNREKSQVNDTHKPPPLAASSAPANPQRTTFERALEGYDPDFEQALVTGIMEVVAATSIVTDANVVAVRTGETTAALVTCLGLVLALCPDHDVPSRLRQHIEQIAKKLRRDVARARAEGLADTILGAAREGHA